MKLIKPTAMALLVATMFAGCKEEAKPIPKPQNIPDARTSASPINSSEEKRIRDKYASDLAHPNIPAEKVIIPQIDFPSFPVRSEENISPEKTRFVYKSADGLISIVQDVEEFKDESRLIKELIMLSRLEERCSELSIILYGNKIISIRGQRTTTGIEATLLRALNDIPEDEQIVTSGLPTPYLKREYIDAARKYSSNLEVKGVAVNPELNAIVDQSWAAEQERRVIYEKLGENPEIVNPNIVVLRKNIGGNDDEEYIAIKTENHVNYQTSRISFFDSEFEPIQSISVSYIGGAKWEFFNSNPDSTAHRFHFKAPLAMRKGPRGIQTDTRGINLRLFYAGDKIYNIEDSK